MAKHVTTEEIKARLATLPKQSQQRVSEQAVKTIPQCFIPSDGPQREAYNCKADLLLFGGSAAGGKSALCVGLALTAHRKSLIMRPQYTELTDLIDKTLKFYGSRDGFNGSSPPSLKTPDARFIQFGACANPGDEHAWQGQEHDLKCVGKDTPVLMADGSYKAIQDIIIGDMVQTLEGSRWVTRILPVRYDEAVEATVGGVMQVQSLAHKILTRYGWASSPLGDAVRIVDDGEITELNVYPHPYTRKIRSSYKYLEYCTFSHKLIGSVDLYDITVDEVNHYITKGGIINKNCFDEVVNFREDQVRFIMTWNRTDVPGQRVRTVFASNPPVNTQGDWIIGMFRPWLDITHPNPAKDGELRWFITDKNGKDIEVENSEPKEDGYKPDGTVRLLIPKSRTFIRSAIDDNPYIAADYKATLDAMKEPFRSALRDGNFMLARKDEDNQLIPTEWVREAQNRWTPKPPEGVPMCAIGVDPAAGGCFDDITEILTNGGWKLFSQLSGSESVLTLNGDNAEWGAITKIHAYPFDGALNVYDGQKVNFAITDNHNLLVRTCPKSLNYAIKRYDELAGVFVIRRANEWVGESIESVNLVCENPQPHGGFRVKEWNFAILDWADFLGWFVSEGWVGSYVRHKNKEIIGIAQKTPHKMKMITDLLDRMGLKYKFEKDKTEVKIYNQSLARHLEDECGIGASNKKIPKYIKEADPQIMTKFLDSFRLGDGSKGSLGQHTYFTSSKLLADDVQEVLCKLGRAGKISRKACAGSSFMIEGRAAIRRYDTYAIYERSNVSHSERWVNRDSEILKKKVKRVPYTGTVYCVSTPLRTIMVRRKGCPMWSGNSDETILAPRYDGYYPQMIVIPGVETPYPQDVAAKVIRYRKGDAVPVIDCGGGYGGGVVRHLEDNGIPSKAHKGAESSTKRTKDRLHAFSSKRAEVYYRFMEALDPSQDGGASIALPPDPKLLSDLCSVRFNVTSRGITLETKVEMKKRLGRSPDRGDAVVLAWSYGDTIATQRGGKWEGGKKKLPQSIMGHMAQRRNR